jgi:hypothetical protein
VDGKARFIFPIVMTVMMVFMVTLLVTIINLGFPSDFLRQWAKAFVLAWPVAAVSAYFAIPIARRVTGRIVAAIDRNPDSAKGNIFPGLRIPDRDTGSNDFKDFGACVRFPEEIFLSININDLTE